MAQAADHVAALKVRRCQPQLSSLLGDWMWAVRHPALRDLSPSGVQAQELTAVGVLGRGAFGIVYECICDKRSVVEQRA